MKVLSFDLLIHGKKLAPNVGNGDVQVGEIGEGEIVEGEIVVGF